MNAQRFRWGVYEKALPACASWTEKLRLASSAGYEFLEISIDESEERLARLEWSKPERRALHQALVETGIPIQTMCLSGHRRYALGSSDSSIRHRGLEIMHRAIDFAAEFGLRIVQVAGYDVFYEPSTSSTRSRYLEAVLQSSLWARQACVMLALENVDCPTVDSITRALDFVSAADSPWFQLYPDVGNLVSTRQDVPSEIRAGGRHIVAVHLKDTVVGELRGIPLGEGRVDFGAAFRALADIGYSGPLVVEMWNERSPDALQRAAEARRWLAQRLEDAAGVVEANFT